MPDSLPTIWPVEPHTRAKHAILKNYLDAWMPIMARQAAKAGSRKEICFIDAFAGPGRYSGGEDGSPILAIKAAIQHPTEFPVPIRLFFIEKDPDRFAVLDSTIKGLVSSTESLRNVVVDPPRCGDCNDILDELLDHAARDQRDFGPALVFLDQTGYSDVPMTLIARIMKNPQCEVFSYLNYNYLTRFLSDDEKDTARTIAFGDDDWMHARRLQGTERERYLLQAYKDKLRERGGARYVWDFAVADSYDKPIYWLFFATNNLRGLEEMKRAMWRVDEAGTFRFSDRSDPSQLKLLRLFSDDWLASSLLERLAGRTLTNGEIKEFVLTETNCYKHANAMQGLYKSEKIEVLNIRPGAKRPSFGKEMDLLVRFPSREI